MRDASEARTERVIDLEKQRAADEQTKREMSSRIKDLEDQLRRLEAKKPQT